MHISKSEIDEDIIYACYVLRSGLLLKQAIPRLPVVRWLLNEINIFKPEANLNILFPPKEGKNFCNLVKLASELDQNIVERVILKVEKKLVNELSDTQISNYFFTSFVQFSTAFIFVIVSLSFLQPFIYSSYQENTILFNDILLTISTFLAGIIYGVYLLYKLNIKLVERILLNNVIAIFKQAQTTSN